MADDRARKLAEDAFNRLAAELDAGKSEAFNNYLAAMGRFHRYSWGNVGLIAYQRPTATHVAGIHTCNRLGRIINEGEKGIMILAPIIKKEKELHRSPTKAGEPVVKQETDAERRPVGFRTAFVFDLAQTHGKPLPEFARTAGDPSQFTDKLRALAAKEGVSLQYDKSIAPAQGVSSGGKIRLLPDMQPAEEFSVLAHELAHEMLHHAKGEERLPKTVVETQAEAVAYVVCRGVGLETNSAAADYIHLYNGDKKTLAESLSVIQGTSLWIRLHDFRIVDDPRAIARGFHMYEMPTIRPSRLLSRQGCPSLVPHSSVGNPSQLIWRSPSLLSYYRFTRSALALSVWGSLTAPTRVPRFPAGSAVRTRGSL